jgi:hypothetical protein
MANREELVKLFDRIESFFKRIKTYAEVPPTPDLIDALAKIMAAVLSILAVATNAVNKKRWSRYIFCNYLLLLNFNQKHTSDSLRERMTSGTPYRSSMNWKEESCSR